MQEVKNFSQVKTLRVNFLKMQFFHFKAPLKSAGRSGPRGIVDL